MYIKFYLLCYLLFTCFSSFLFLTPPGTLDRSPFVKPEVNIIYVILSNAFKSLLQFILLFCFCSIIKISVSSLRPLLCVSSSALCGSTSQRNVFLNFQRNKKTCARQLPPNHVYSQEYFMILPLYRSHLKITISCIMQLIHSCTNSRTCLMRSSCAFAADGATLNRTPIVLNSFVQLTKQTLMFEKA